ncbi:hypothetical protein [Candidatus Electronema sp. JC]|uniref:hypothetical protein n=1 Tax=Candidatus Electronema sp. JC TaxID=3401570 RepID=UPI003B433144
MNDNSKIEIRILSSRTAYRSFDVQDEPLVAEAIRTRVLPAAEAAYWRVDVKIKRKTDQTPNHLIAYLLRKDSYLAEVVRVDIQSDYKVTSITWGYDESQEEEGDEESTFPISRDQAACEFDFVVATPVPEIQTAKGAVEFLHKLFTSLGFKSKMLLGAEATVANYRMHLASGIKGFVNIGHGNTNGIALADGFLDAVWFNSLSCQAADPAVVYFNSCQVHNDPLKSAVMKAGARTFIGGIVNLLIGPSEEVCKCFWSRALQAAVPMGKTLCVCEKEKYPQEGAHGISGDTGIFMAARRLVVAAASEDGIADPGNRRPNYLVVSVTDINGEPVTGLEASSFKVDPMIVGPGGALVEITAVRAGRLPGFYHIDLVPIRRETWKQGVYSQSSIK